MNIQRFHAPTAREALAKARMTFGEGTLILSNRAKNGGIEVVATAEETLPALAKPAPAALPTASRVPTAQPPAAQRATTAAARTPGALRNSPPARDAERLAMSTLSFQDYVRERMLQRRHEALQGIPAQPATPNPLRPMHAALGAERITAQPAPRSAPARPISPATAAAAHIPTLAEAGQQHNLMQALQAMHALIEERFSTLGWLEQTRKNPIGSQLLLKLIRSGYSPTLARALLQHLPPHLGAAQAVRWLMQVLERNLKTDAQPLHQSGGIHALVGTAGTGKTTTLAKLAAQCAHTHGADSVGIITTDTRRPASHEQLRAHAQSLGIVTHQASDGAALQDLLGLLSGKKMLLIDTAGITARQARKHALPVPLNLSGINRLLVLDASAHGDTLDDVLNAFHTPGAQQAILTKLDSAIKPGCALDALIRHQMLLRGISNGQRVPQDWQSANARQLVAISMRSNSKSAFDPQAAELGFFFTPPIQAPRQPVHSA